MNLFEIAWLSDEQVKMFKSDFYILADYFVQMRKNKDYVPSKKTIDHVDSLIKLMAAITGDNRFEEGLKTLDDNFGRRKINMCEYLDKIISQGEAKGTKEKGIEVFINCINRKMSKKEAQSIANISDELVEEAYARMNQELQTT